MKWIITVVTLVASTILFAGSASYNTNVHGSSNGDTAKNEASLASYVTMESVINHSAYSLKNMDAMISENKPAQFILGHSKQNRQIDAFYFPGASNKRALVIAGVHGSELSSVEVAYQLLKNLSHGGQPYYSVVIVPSLFPDNAVKAMDNPSEIGGISNIGRYSLPSAVDPNRQMPSPGKAFDEKTRLDHLGRPVETENRLLLQLIEVFKPQRIASLHAIRNMDYGGVYADPRTDEKGMALGYETDSSLAVAIALQIRQGGGNVDGNDLDNNPTALYYKDPLPVPKGFFQPRNMTGSALKAKRGSGISLGTWASTAIAGEDDPAKNRDAMRIITIEYPGYKRSVDYAVESEQLFQQKQVELFANAIYTIFLGRYFVEDDNSAFVNK